MEDAEVEKEFGMWKRRFVVLILMAMFAGAVMPGRYADDSTALAKPRYSSKLTLRVGEKKQYAYYQINGSKKWKISNKKIKWKSYNKRIAVVSKKGVIRGKSKGKTKVSARYGSKILYIKVTVKTAITGKVHSADAEKNIPPAIGNNDYVYVTPVPVTRPIATPIPTKAPIPTLMPTPTKAPTERPTQTPTERPTREPTEAPTERPIQTPTKTPTQEPTAAPIERPTQTPTKEPIPTPTQAPTPTPDVEELAYSIELNATKVGEKILFVAENISNYMIPYYTLYIELKNSMNETVDEFYIYGYAIEPNEEQLYAYYGNSTVHDVIINESEYTTTIYMDMPYKNITSDVIATEEARSDNSIDFAFCNTGEKWANIRVVVMFYDSEDNICGLCGDNIYLDAGVTYYKQVSPDYYYDSVGNYTNNFSNYIVKYYAYTY